ncbi:MAG: ATP-dependent DNA helicase RecG [Nostocoides sp.]
MIGPSSRLPDIVAKAAGPLAKARGIRTVEDLLGFWPRRYLSPGTNLAGLHNGMYAVVVADVKTAVKRPMKVRKGSILNVTVTDGSNDLDITFFKPFGHEAKLVPGARAVFAGQVSYFNGKPQLAHPDYEILDPHGEFSQRGLMPIYSRVPGMQNWKVSQCVQLVLDQLDDLPDPIPLDIRLKHRLDTRLESLALIHTPHTREQVARAQNRMRFEEAFVIQTALALRRAEQAREAATPRRARAGGLLDAFDARMPFDLTDGQVAVGVEITTDLAAEIPMNRLLQGEVGSGKTVVALRAMLTVVDAGGQAALLAPTEVLAQQHHRSISAMLGRLAEAGMLGGSDVGTQVALLTGSMGKAARQQAMLSVVTGEAGIVVGTHALLEDVVEFRDLALVVVDEQHRFGVEQRDALRAKGSAPPHLLVMTATPIPRTVAMTVFGDMATSTLTELPRGRAPIVTHTVAEHREGWMARVWQRVGEQAAQGRQVYVVCPRIHADDTGAADGLALLDTVSPRPKGCANQTDSDDFELWDDEVEDVPVRTPPHAVLAVVERLRTEVPSLDGRRIEVLHGQMAPEDKDATMTAFAHGDIDVLVATTVIEVGVDVPNATVMVVLDADRFGVSQLHQLRGRIGRGGHAGLCLLVSGSDNEDSLARLEAVASTTDGFELARLDLSQRREGDILGSAQSGGRNSLRSLSLLRDEEIIVAAHDDAFALVAADPTLAGHPDLRAAVVERLDEDQAAFLERG